MENKIPTAEEFFEANNGLYSASYSVRDKENGKYVSVVSYDKAIEFAKMHVKAALEMAAEKANLKGETAHNNGAPDKIEESVYVVDQNGPDYIYTVNKNSIINAYPESNIK